MADRLKNVLQVVEYLNNGERRVSKSTVYNHVKAGRLIKGNDGGFSRAAVDRYAQSLDGDASADPIDPESISELKQSRARKEAAQARHWEIKTKILEDEYVEREWAERQLAARAMILKSDFENFCRSKAGEIVARSDGKLELVPDVGDFMMAEFQKMISRYSDPIEFQTDGALTEQDV